MGRHRMRTLGGAALAGAVLLTAAACSKSEPPDPAATMEESCAEARDTFASAPAPVDDATDEAFLEAASTAFTQAYSPGFDLRDDVDDDALFRLVQYFGQIPGLVGAHTAIDVAYDTRAIIPFLDELAGELGAPACGADSWRLEDYEAMTERLAPDVDEADYLADVEAACQAAFGATTTPIVDPTGVAAIVTSRAAMTEFHRLVAIDVPPPASLDEEHLALMAAMAQYDVAVADVEREPQPADVDEVTGAAIDALAAAIEGLGVAC